LNPLNLVGENGTLFLDVYLSKDMPILTRLSVALNIRPGEGQLVTLLLVHSFFIGIAKVFTSAAASALFIDEFGAQALP
jgi:hypothetical protein